MTEVVTRSMDKRLDDPVEERLYRKQRLAAAFRLVLKVRVRRGCGWPHHGP